MDGAPGEQEAIPGERRSELNHRHSCSGGELLGNRMLQRFSAGWLRDAKCFVFETGFICLVWGPQNVLHPACILPGGQQRGSC